MALARWKVTAMRPYGYTADRTALREHEAKFIRDAADRILNGETLRSVAAALNAEGARTPAGNEWQPKVLKRVLVSLRVAGKEVTRGGKLRDGDWPAILDGATHKRLVKILNDPSKARGGAQPNRVYLLTHGVAVCGLCGHQLIARPNNNGQRGYVCSSGVGFGGCGKIRIKAEFLENDIAERVLARLMRPDARKALLKQQQLVDAAAESAPAELAAVEKRLEEIGVDYADGKIGATEMHAARGRLAEKARAARAKQKLSAALGSVSAMEAEDLAAWWEGASLGQQRALLELLIERVEVFPVKVRGSKIFDPSRVQVKWRS